MSLKDDIERRIARYETRREDWTVFGFETALNPKYARSQRRYIGASGSVDHAAQPIESQASFTMSIQTMPPGNVIPVHRHETEETFFILDGTCLVTVFRGDEKTTVRLNKWDLISVPEMVYHDIQNDGEIPCAVQTLLSKPRPGRPDYQDPKLLELQAQTYTS
jgi:mannose-6-phosphate isomerase-like protein (cupin superfamily)